MDNHITWVTKPDEKQNLSSALIIIIIMSTCFPNTPLPASQSRLQTPAQHTHWCFSSTYRTHLALILQQRWVALRGILHYLRGSQRQECTNTLRHADLLCLSFSTTTDGFPTISSTQIHSHMGSTRGMSFRHCVTTPHAGIAFPADSIKMSPSWQIDYGGISNPGLIVRKRTF